MTTVKVTLFCVTSLYDLMLELLLEERSRGDVFVVTTHPRTKEVVEEYGIHCYLFQPSGVSVSERDKAFAELAMPGILGDATFHGTDLATWEVLSLDRFKFWYSYETPKLCQFLGTLEWTKTYISLTFAETLPWIIVDEATRRDVDCVAVLAESIRTKEFLDMAKFQSFDEYIVPSIGDKEFLETIYPEAKITVREQDKVVPLGSVERELVRKGLGMSEDEVIYGLFFDKRDEWQCRKWLSENVGKINILIVPADERSWQLLPDVLHQYLPHVKIYRDFKLLNICESVISFRYDESYIELFKDKILILDYLNLNKTRELVDDSG